MYLYVQELYVRAVQEKAGLIVAGEPFAGTSLAKLAESIGSIGYYNSLIYEMRTNSRDSPFFTETNKDESGGSNQLRDRTSG